jgi:CheY-like chemotaxis protein
MMHGGKSLLVRKIDTKKATKNNNEKKTVLFVDDEEMFLEVGSLMLQRVGYNVLTTNNGQEAIEIFRKNEVAFVILDLRMPAMNGDEVCRQLKKIKPKVKILLASGYVKFYSEDYIVDIGFDDSIEKPFTIEHLSKKIENILSK